MTVTCYKISTEEFAVPSSRPANNGSQTQAQPASPRLEHYKVNSFSLRNIDNLKQFVILTNQVKVC